MPIKLSPSLLKLHNFLTLCNAWFEKFLKRQPFFSFIFFLSFLLPLVTYSNTRKHKYKLWFNVSGNRKYTFESILISCIFFLFFYCSGRVWFFEISANIKIYPLPYITSNAYLDLEPKMKYAFIPKKKEDFNSSSRDKPLTSFIR